MPIDEDEVIHEKNGVKIYIYKQDPTVIELGVRKCFLPVLVQPGPKDSSIVIAGLNPVQPNKDGDFLEKPGTNGFDAVHTYAIVRQTLLLFERAFGGLEFDWQWNQGVKDSLATPITVYPHAAERNNAFYARELKGLYFGYCVDKNAIALTYFCRSLDVVAHETGHAILDGIKPNWNAPDSPLQTGGLHESFADLTAIFLVLSQLDQVEAIVAETKANLHTHNFLAEVAEQVGWQLSSRKDGLRCANNNFKLSQVEPEVHAVSEVFTGAVYNILADIYQFKRDPRRKDDAVVLFNIGAYVHSLVARAVLAAPDRNASYADVGREMLKIVKAEKAPPEYTTFIKQRFEEREIKVSSPPNPQADHSLPLVKPGTQNRSSCCSTLQRTCTHKHK